MSLLIPIPKMNDENGHSQFLVELFKNQKYLRTFLNIIESKIIFDWDNIKVSFEEPASLESKNGRIDIFLTDGKNALLIENKINAGDQEKQLQRYAEWAENQHLNFEIFYLSPNESNPSPNGLGTLTLDDIRKISYTKHIKEWLEKIASDDNEYRIIKNYLEQLNEHFSYQASARDELLYLFFEGISKEGDVTDTLRYIDEPLNRSHMPRITKKNEFFLRYEYIGKEVLFMYDKTEDSLFLRMNADDFNTVLVHNQGWEKANNNYDFIVYSVEDIFSNLTLALSESLSKMEKAFV